MRPFIVFLVFLLTGLTACRPVPERRAPATPLPSADLRTVCLPHSSSPVPAASPSTPAPAPTPDTRHHRPTATPTLAPDAWMFMPVIPTFSDTPANLPARPRHGTRPASLLQSRGLRKHHRLVSRRLRPRPAHLSPRRVYADLQTTIDYYEGSFERESVAVRRGANTSSLLTSLWADPKLCEAGESMLACEYRVHNPSVVLIAVGSNDALGVDNFEEQMRRIIEFTISRGHCPHPRHQSR